MSILFTIFGASGDLTFRKLLPACYNLYMSQCNKDIRILAIARKDMTVDEYIEKARVWIERFARFKVERESYDAFAKNIDYYQMDIQDTNEYEGLASYISDYEDVEQYMYYLAVAPSLFMPITEGIVDSGLNYNNSSVIIEKPFGENIFKAEKLNDMLNRAFLHDNVYHIDHYLGKEMIQNILAVRFKNIIFKEIWNSDYIDNVLISAYEQVGVETRGGYYDNSGAMKDMVQNHLLQVLSIVAMSEPSDDTAKSIHAAQLEVLESLVPVRDEEVEKYLVMAQYEGYRDEQGVDSDSMTETYVALKVNLDMPRWEGVPFVIRTGKNLSRRETEIVIQFKSIVPDIMGNILLIKIQPQEGIYLEFNIKKPGTTSQTYRAQLDYTQSDSSVAQENTPEAYERLINAAMNKDASLFSQWNQIVASWKFTNAITESFISRRLPLATYKPNSDGPAEAHRLLEILGCPMHIEK